MGKTLVFFVVLAIACPGCIQGEKSAKQLYDEGKDAFAENDFELALLKFKRAIELDSNFAEAYEKKAMAYFKLAKYEEARVSAEKASELFPNDFRPYLVIANIHKEKGENEKALAFLKKAEEKNPFDHVVNNVLADHYYHELKDCDKASEHAERALKANPGDTFAPQIIDLCELE